MHSDLLFLAKNETLADSVRQGFTQKFFLWCRHINKTHLKLGLLEMNPDS